MTSKRWGLAQFQLLCMIVMPVLACASPSKVPALQARAAHLVAAVSHGQQHVVRVFRGPDGLLGTVVENASRQRDIAWLSPHADAVLAGPLLGSHGEDLTRAAKVQQGIYLSPAATLQQASSPARRGITVGTRGPLITVFFDANCIYCHLLYGKLAPLVADGKLRVRYLVVGTLKASSTPRGAAILAAAHPAKALDENETAFRGSGEEGGFPIASHPDPTFISVVDSNSALFVKAGIVGTPAILFCNKQGAVQLAPGVPEDIPVFVNAAGQCR